MPTTNTLDPYAVPQAPPIPGMDRLSLDPLLAQQQQSDQHFQSEGTRAAKQAQDFSLERARRAAAKSLMPYALNPDTAGKGFNELPPQIRDKILADNADIAPEIPGLHAGIQSAITGRPVGANIPDGATGSMDVNGMKISGIQPTDASGQPSGNIAGMADMIANYRINPNLSRMPPAQKIRLYTMAQKINPNFDAQEYDARLKARESFEPGGKNGQSILASNTLIDHLGQVHALVDSLNNAGSRFVNAPMNWVKEGTGNTALTKFQTAANTAANEYAKALAGGNQPAEPEIQKYQAMLNPNLSPEQLKENLRQMSLMAGAKMHQMQSEWANSVKSPRDIPFLNKEQRETLLRIGVNPNLIAPGEPGQPEPTATPPATPPATTKPAEGEPTLTDKSQFDALPSGSFYIRNGKQYQKP